MAMHLGRVFRATELQWAERYRDSLPGAVIRYGAIGDPYTLDVDGCACESTQFQKTIAELDSDYRENEVFSSGPCLEHGRMNCLQCNDETREKCE